MYIFTVGQKILRLRITLEIATNNILSQIRPEIQIHIKNSENRESIDIIHKINGKDLVHAQLSHGQKYIVDLSIMIGLAEVMRTSLGVKPGFLEFDEIDQGIDREALENLVKLIHKLRETYVIFIITHNDWMKDQFKSCIVVDGDDVNGSTATMEINA
jgi:DNA repair exonuclease SbcCD ATPase subunit